MDIKEVLEEKVSKQYWLADELGKSYNRENSYVQTEYNPDMKYLTRLL